MTPNRKHDRIKAVLVALRERRDPLSAEAAKIIEVLAGDCDILMQRARYQSQKMQGLKWRAEEAEAKAD